MQNVGERTAVLGDMWQPCWERRAVELWVLSQANCCMSQAEWKEGVKIWWAHSPLRHSCAVCTHLQEDVLKACTQLQHSCRGKK